MTKPERVGRGFAFEDFTLVLTRDCNFACEYCPLDHQPRHMGAKVIKDFFPQLLAYAERDVLVTLFGGEPLLNSKAVELYLRLARQAGPRFAASGGRLWTKIVTNGLLLDGHLSALAKTARVPGLALELNISTDGGRETQARQRPLRGGGGAYYPRLAKAIERAKDLGVPLSLGMVAGFSSPSLVDDYTFLCDTYGLPVFVMPVDLTYEFIRKTPDIAAGLIRYARRLKELMVFLRANTRYAAQSVNLGEPEFRDLKVPPLGPTIDWDGSVYVTRDFLFTMDKAVSFRPIGKLNKSNLGRFVAHFGASRESLKPLAQSAMRSYFGRTMPINKKIGDYFTRMVYSRP